MRTQPNDEVQPKKKEKTVVPIALSRRSAARAIDRSEAYLRIRERFGDGPVFARHGKAIFYTIESLREWINRNASPGGPSAA